MMCRVKWLTGFKHGNVTAFCCLDRGMYEEVGYCVTPFFTVLLFLQVFMLKYLLIHEQVKIIHFMIGNIFFDHPN